MFLCVLVLFCSLLNSALATDLQKVSCNASATNLKNEAVNVANYCKDRPCITKCCGQNEVLYNYKINKTKTIIECTNINNIDVGDSKIKFDYSNLKIYQSDIETNINETSKNLMKDFNVLQNKVLLNENCGLVWHSSFKGYILENGKFAGDLKNHKNKRWVIKEAQTFCVELIVGKSKITKKYISRYSYYYVKPPPDTIDKTSKLYFTGAAMLISSFFLLLVLLVYSVLPQLHNLKGMLVMAYASTLFMAFLIKVITIFSRSINVTTCKIISPMMYFMLISSFLWLNIMSFDIWWTCRGSRLQRAIHRRGEFVKFLWYCLYAYGVAAGMTLAAVLVDNADLTNWPNIIKPYFDSCLHEDDANARYLYAPIGILTFVNIVLFIMTMYNIWLIKKMLNNVKSSNTNKRNENRFRMYFSMSLLMGISWALEVIQALYDDVGLWPYILMNFFNTLIGVAIFFMFVFKKSILIMLCKRFNIKCKFVEELKLNSSTKSTVSRSRSSNKSSFYKTKSLEETETQVNDSTTV